MHDLKNGKLRKQKYGLRVKDLVQNLKDFTKADDELIQKVKRTLDHAHPDIVTWKDFISWFASQGEVRDKVHNAQLFKQGLTRIYQVTNIEQADETEGAQDTEFKLYDKRTEYKVQSIIPCQVDKGLNLLFIVFDNQVANFYDVDREMMKIH